MRITNRIDRAGLTLIEIMIVVAIIGFLLALAIPNIHSARVKAARQVCIGNMMQLDAAKQRWAIGEKKDVTETPTYVELIGPDLYLKQRPVCPSGGTYVIGDVQTRPTCSLADPDGHSLD